MDHLNELKQRIKELEETVTRQAQQIKDYEFIIESINARIHHLVQEFRSDLKRLHEIQKMIVPKEIKKISGIEFSSRFIPGEKIGGDYYDVFPIESTQRFGIIMSSAGSYGLSSLVLSVLVAVSPRIGAKSNFNFEESVQKLIDQVKEFMKPEDTWHFLCGIFDKKYLQFNFVHFGNIFIASKKNNMEKFFDFQSMNSPIQKEGNINFSTYQINLDPTGAIVFVSPGVFHLDVSKSVSQILNESTVMSDPHEWRNHIFRSAISLNKSSHFLRDQTVLVFQIKDRAIRIAT